MRKVAVTGEIASGKSTVCRLFKELGAYCVSADEIVHQLLIPTTPLGKDVIALLGSDVVVGGEINRQQVAQKVFDNPTLLRKLEKRIHPEVQNVIETHYTTALKQGAPLFVAEVPLLFEAGLDKYYDTVVVVTSDTAKCRERFPFNQDEYDRRIKRLMPIEDKIKQADCVIENSGTLEELNQTIQPLFFALKETL